MKTIEDFRDALFNILKAYDGKKANLMISGGSLLDCLGDIRYKDLNTFGWCVYFCDERVSPEHSNFQNAKNFLNKIQGRIFKIEITEDPNEDAKRYADVIRHTIENNNEKFDLCLLGIGENGHICSLWPDSELLDTDEYVIHSVVDSPVSPNRITVTLATINKFVNSLIFVIPPKNGVLKKIVKPAESIEKRLKIPFSILRCTQ